MKERPILFSAPMVRALLAGTKTQTRRPLREQPPAGVEAFQTYHHPKGIAHYGWDEADKSLMSWCAVCPYGVPGDRLWVREAWAGSLANVVASQHEAQVGTQRGMVAYRATFQGERSPWGKWRPSIHMPRWASRITLEVTEVRVERLQDISEADATAEGSPHSLHLPGGRFARENFEHLWWTINGDGSWEANPWVWAVSFRKVA